MPTVVVAALLPGLSWPLLCLGWQRNLLGLSGAPLPFAGGRRRAGERLSRLLALGLRAPARDTKQQSSS